MKQKLAEHKGTEEALRQSEARYRTLVENARDVIYAVSEDAVISSLNPAFERITGWSRSEWIGKPLQSIVHPGDWPKELELLERMLEGETPPAHEVRVRSKSGEYWTGEFMITPLFQEGRFAGVLGVGRDISERKRIERELRIKENSIDLSVSAISLADLGGNLTYVNPAFLKLWGYNDEKEILGKPVAKFWYTEEQAQVVVDALFDKGDWVGELVARGRDGSTFSVHLSASMIKDDAGEPICMMASFVDITEAKRAEEEKRRLQAQLQQAQKMEAIGTLAGGIAHDFNNILSIIIGYTELSRYYLPEDSEVQASLQEVYNAGIRAKDLVRQILTFSRQREEEKRPLQISPVINEALKLLRASLPTTIEIRQNMKTASDIVLTNPTHIDQVLMNLCTNAAHAMRENGGVLEVRLEDVDLGIEAAAQNSDLKPGAYMKLTVSDTGTGIEPGIMERIFDPYFTTKGPGQGTGMGLAVVHGIVKSTGGAITVDSKLGEGTTIAVFFPRTESNLTPEARALGPFPTGTERILFVDDEKPLVDIGAQMLEHLGYQVVSRTSSIEALEAFRVQPEKFDLIITDQTMPNMTGEMFAKELIQIRPDIPIVLCTGYSETISEEKAKSLGIRKLLMKPILIREMSETIREVLDQGDEDET